MPLYFSRQEGRNFFFKSIKPKFIYRLIYYNEIYILESSRPYGNSKFVRHYLKRELARLTNYIEANAEFYRYFRTGNTSCDESYFLRGKPNLSFAPDSFYFDSDHEFSTSHDFKVARFMANDLLHLYIQQQFSEIKIKDALPRTDTKNLLQWTGPKVYFIELVYALHASGIINNGHAELKLIITSFSGLFGIDPGQFNRTFLEIRERKSDRTKFISLLAQQLIRRMDQADEK